MLRRVLALALAGAVVGACAAELGAPPGTPDNTVIPDAPEWKELDTPPPPPLRTQGLIPIEVEGSRLSFGVDPASISIGSDSIVRYVVVAKGSGGALNAMYEGLRCDGGQVKVYARYTPGQGWVPVTDANWQPLRAGAASTRHSMAIARGGACMETAPNGSASRIAQDLKAPADRRFYGGGVNR
jgi:hypothetical protein